MSRRTTLGIAVSSAFLLACGSSSDNDAEPSGEQPSPTFSLSVSDAPVENVMQVVVCFNEIELRAVDNSQTKTLLIGDSEGSVAANDLCTDADGILVPNTVGIDLLSLAGMASTELLTDIEISAGEYSQIRLSINEHSYAIVDLDQDGVADDIDLDGNADKVPVRVPSNELKLDGFTATLGGELNFTVEFDLRKGMTNPQGQEGYILKPRGVRLVDNSTSGHIEGTVAESLLINNSCTVAPVDITQGVASVYIYQGTGLDTSQLADNGGTESIEALASTGVYFDGVDTYNYEIGFVNAGSYTMALTCDEDTDPEADDVVNFFSIKEVAVNDKGQITELNFTE
jgi:hypothetical protein